MTKSDTGASLIENNNVEGNLYKTKIAGDQHNHNHYHSSQNTRLDSNLSLIILRLSKLGRIKSYNKLELKEYSIEGKIAYNNVLTYRSHIDTFSAYFMNIEKIYNELNDNTPGTKDSTLEYINLQYREVVNNLLAIEKDKSLIEIIKQYADTILKQVEIKLENDLLNLSNCDGIFTETLKTSLPKIIVHAFISCEVLEKPIE